MKSTAVSSLYFALESAINPQWEIVSLSKEPGTLDVWNITVKDHRPYSERAEFADVAEQKENQKDEEGGESC